MEFIPIIALLFGLVGAIASIYGIKLNANKERQNHDERVKAQAVFEERMRTMKLEIDKAHDKIRELYQKDLNKSELITRIEGTLDENTRILRNIEKLLITAAVLEERLNSHIAASKD